MKQITYGVVTTILLVLGTGMPLVEAQSSNSTNTDWFFDMLLSDLIIHPADSNGMMMYPLPIEEINIGNESITYGVEVTNSSVAPTCNPTNGPQPYGGPTSHMNATSSSFWIFTHAVSSGNSTVTCTSGSTTASLSVTTDYVFHDLSWGMPEVVAEPEPEPEVETTTNLSTEYTITIMGNEGCETLWGCFDPFVLYVPENSQVRFYNPTDSMHVISGATQSGNMAALMVEAGQHTTIPFPLTEVEVIAYTCNVHPWEYGEIVVGDMEYVSADILSETLNDVAEPTDTSSFNELDYQTTIADKEGEILIMHNQLADLVLQMTGLVQSNSMLQSEVEDLQYQVANQPITNSTQAAEIEELQLELETWQEAAERWKQVALNQLQVMINVLGI